MGTIRVKRLNWVVVLYPTTNLSGAAGCKDLIVAFRAEWAKSYQGIVINLAEVQRVDSTGFAALIDCATRARRTGTKLALCCVAPTVDRFLGVIGHQPAWRFISEDDAIRYCSER